MAKPFSIQAPEDIAKEYAGNKQKIAQAAQMGIVDPTAAVLAGMFIDRMRSAQVMEGGQQPTVAQQVLGGGQPQMAPTGAPPMGAPPPMAPPMGAPMGAPPPMAPPPQDMAPPPPEMDMASQGMAGGGLAELPIPDTMFDEPTNGGFDDGYADGGMVAFAAGDTVDVDEDGDGSPDTYFGYNYKDPSANAAMRDKLFGVPETKYSSEYEADLLKRRTPEAQKASRKKDINMAMIEAGIAMANTPGSLFQSATRGIGAALPGLKAAEKERRAEEREIQRGLLDLEQGRNTVAAQKAMQLIEMQRTGIQGREGQIGREFQRSEAEAGRAFTKGENALDRQLRRYEASLRGRGDGSGSGTGGGKPQYSQAQAEKGYKNASARMTAAFKEGEKLAEKGDMAGARKYFSEYTLARRAANEFALAADLPEYTTLPTTKSKGIQAYTKHVMKEGQPALKASNKGSSKNSALDAALAEYG